MLTRKERFLTAVRGEQPDRVPMFDFLFQQPVYEALIGHKPGTYNAKDAVELALRLDHDGVWLPVGGYNGFQPKYLNEDTYVDLRVETLNVQAGVCVSRFDTTVFTTTTARLSYQSQPVPVRVSLLHAAGLSGGGTTGHAATVLRSVQQKVQEFASRIRAASR